MTPQLNTVDSGLYPIGTVSELTGVNAITLRAWERRYSLFEPVRKASGHRLYTQQHIDLINRIVGLLEETVADYEMSTQWEQQKRVKRVAADSATEAGQKAWKSVRDKRGRAEVEETLCEVYERKGGPRVAHLERSGWKDG